MGYRISFPRMSHRLHSGSTYSNQGLCRKPSRASIILCDLSLWWDDFGMLHDWGDRQLYFCSCA